MPEPPPRKTGRPNPLVIGGVGVLLTLGGYLGIHSATDLHLLWQSRVVFFLGLGVVLLGLVLWVKEASLPDEPVEVPAEEEPEDEDSP
jgi:hypothetical protein